MGAWDLGALDNDDAQDFIADILSSRGDRWRMVELALMAICDAPDGATTGSLEESEALAACEMIAAAASGSSSDGLDEELASWVMRTAPKHLHMLSQTAIRVVGRLAAKSELHDRWSASGDLSSWLASLADLRKRLAISIH